MDTLQSCVELSCQQPLVTEIHEAGSPLGRVSEYNIHTQSALSPPRFIFHLFIQISVSPSLFTLLCIPPFFSPPSLIWLSVFPSPSLPPSQPIAPNLTASAAHPSNFGLKTSAALTTNELGTAQPPGRRPTDTQHTDPGSVETWLLEKN